MYNLPSKYSISLGITAIKSDICTSIKILHITGRPLPPSPSGWQFNFLCKALIWSILTPLYLQFRSHKVVQKKGPALQIRICYVTSYFTLVPTGAGHSVFAGAHCYLGSLKTASGHFVWTAAGQREWLHEQDLITNVRKGFLKHSTSNSPCASTALGRFHIALKCFKLLHELLLGYLFLSYVIMPVTNRGRMNNDNVHCWGTCDLSFSYIGTW